MHLRSRFVWLLALVVVLLTACGDDSDVNPDPLSSDTSTDTVVDTAEDGAGEDIRRDSAADMPDVPSFPTRDVMITVDTATVRATVSERFLSVAVDSSQVSGGVFWNPEDGSPTTGLGTSPQDPYDFGRPRLRNLAAALAPAYLRIGGSEADNVFYDLSDNPVTEAPEPYDLVLNRTQWDGLYDFAEALDYEVFFTLNAGPGPRDAMDAWTPDNARELLTYIRDQNHQLGILELGNELNGFALFHDGLNITPTQYAADLAVLRQLANDIFPDNTPPIAGPSSAYWPMVGEIVPYMADFLRTSGATEVDVVTWHYYPQQSTRCPLQVRPAEVETMLSVENLDEINTWAGAVEVDTTMFTNNAEVWLGESGHAQCGGQIGVSDRFVSGFWWLDQLGLMARRGQQVVVRQTLSGSNYGLINDETLVPNPDYWVSLLWRRLMGTRVLTTTSSDNELRVYAHCLRGFSGGVAVGWLNVNGETGVRLRWPGATGRAQVYRLTAQTLTSADVSLNGTVLSVTGDDIPPDMTPLAVEVDATEAWVLPPHSYGYVALPEASAAACR